MKTNHGNTSKCNVNPNLRQKKHFRNHTTKARTKGYSLTCFENFIRTNRCIIYSNLALIILQNHIRISEPTSEWVNTLIPRTSSFRCSPRTHDLKWSETTTNIGSKLNANGRRKGCTPLPNIPCRTGCGEVVIRCSRPRPRPNKSKGTRPLRLQCFTPLDYDKTSSDGNGTMYYARLALTEILPCRKHERSRCDNNSVRKWHGQEAAGTHLQYCKKENSNRDGRRLRYTSPLFH